MKSIHVEWHSADQRQIFWEDKTRFIIVAAGRRYGKTRGAVNALMLNACYNPQQQFAWIAPIYRQAKIAFRYFIQAFKKEKIFDIEPNKSNLEITLYNGSVIQFRSGDNPSSIEGEGYHVAVLDESWQLLNDDYIWFDVVRPTLMDTRGRAYFIGRAGFEGTLFYTLFEKGLDADDKDYKSYIRTTYDNPLIDRQEIENTKRELPEAVFKQQILGEFLADGERAIPNIHDCAVAQTEDFYKSAWSPYIMGLDLAKHEDYTVITIGRRGSVICIERFNQLSWPVQEKIIINFAEKYQAKIIIDSTGIGDPIYDFLLEKGMDIKPYKFTETSRRQLLELLILRMNQKLLTFPKNDILISELKSMRWTITKSDKARLEVPQGKHDDCVMSLALCNWGMIEAFRLPKIKEMETFNDIIYDNECIDNGDDYLL